VGSTFTATIGQNDHLSWQNTSPGGPLTINASEQLVVTGTGLVPHTQYTCVLLGAIGSGASGQASPLPMPTSIMVSGIPGATPVGVAASIDELSTGTGVTFTPLGATLGPITAADDYETICVSLYQQPATPTPVAVAVVGDQIAQQSSPQSILLNSTTPVGPLFFPFPIAAGQPFSVILTSLTGSNLPAPVGVNVYGLGSPAQPSPLRADGRLKPAGSQVATGSISSSSRALALIPAPPSPASILLQSIDMQVTDPADEAFGYFEFTKNGNSVTTFLYRNATALGPSAGEVWPEGFLLDPATQLTLLGNVGSSATGNIAASAVYDLVL
jgi:hypothetical protein